MNLAGDLIDKIEAARNVYKVERLTAVRALTKTREEILSNTISSCWTHSKLRPTYDNSDPHTNISKLIETLRGTLKQQLSSMAPVHARRAIGFFINYPDEKDCVENLNDEEALFGTDTK